MRPLRLEVEAAVVVQTPGGFEKVGIDFPVLGSPLLGGGDVEVVADLGDGRLAGGDERGVPALCGPADAEPSLFDGKGVECLLQCVDGGCQ